MACLSPRNLSTSTSSSCLTNEIPGIYFGARSSQSRQDRTPNLVRIGNSISSGLDTQSRQDWTLNLVRIGHPISSGWDTQSRQDWTQSRRDWTPNLVRIEPPGHPLATYYIPWYSVLTPKALESVFALSCRPSVFVAGVRRADSTHIRLSGQRGHDKIQ